MQTFHEIKQEPPSGLFSSLMQHWGYGSLGNMQVQWIPTTDETFPNESIIEAHRHFNSQFEAASPGARLRALKATRFPAASRVERVQRSLQALSQPLGIKLSAEDWALVAELTEEDEE
ncbi:MAG: hypothetical protein WAN12_19655 [Candidatus Acidiferrum sp.]